jgi:hypothetical protein
MNIALLPLALPISFLINGCWHIVLICHKKYILQGLTRAGHRGPQRHQVPE